VHMRSLLAAALAAILLTALTGSALAQQGRAVAEIEPNDGAQTATLARLGDTISGTVNPDDVDYFAVDLEAGTQLELIATPVPFCRDFAFVAPNGNRLAFADCMDGIDTLRITIPERGRYFIRVTQFDDAPTQHPMHPYSLHIGTATPAIDVSSVVAALLTGDSTGLDPSVRRTLDLAGNGNGAVDIGDLRAYLRTLHPLSGSKGNARNP